jgi:hypothetical protein
MHQTSDVDDNDNSHLSLVSRKHTAIRKRVFITSDEDSDDAPDASNKRKRMSSQSSLYIPGEDEPQSGKDIETGKKKQSLRKKEMRAVEDSLS